jgi:hypothetical protein
MSVPVQRVALTADMMVEMRVALRAVIMVEMRVALRVAMMVVGMVVMMVGLTDALTADLFIFKSFFVLVY